MVGASPKSTRSSRGSRPKRSGRGRDRDIAGKGATIRLSVVGVRPRLVPQVLALPWRGLDSMSDFQASQVTQILREIVGGDDRSAERLLPSVYSELRVLARALLSKVPPGNTLQPTDLVHQAYLRIVGENDPGWSGRRHFFGAAAQAMRRILVEQARRKATVKHGGGKKRVDAGDLEIPIESPVEDMLALDEALGVLSSVDERKARVVELRFLVGLDISETAEVLGVSEPTVERDWRFARAFLYDRLRSRATGLLDDRAGGDELGRGGAAP
jgi:RNA polymerase sigma factor (TIGR02999 family)